MPRMGSATSTEEKISPDDIEAKMREIFEGAQEGVADTKSQLTTLLGIVGIVVVLLAYVFGRRAGRKRTTLVEIRRL